MNIFTQTQTFSSKLLVIATVCSIVLSFLPLSTSVARADHDAGGPYEGEVLGHQNDGGTLDKIRICHSTASDSNPYTNPEVNISSFFSSGHDADLQDIIPPFHYTEGDGILSFPGTNWDTDGQAIWDNGCVEPVTPIPGCTDDTATNYNPEATEDDGSCVFPVVCTDDTADNFESEGECVYSAEVTICKLDNSETPLAGWEVHLDDGAYGGTTGDDGCYTITNVPYGDYTLGEVMKDGWSNVSGDGEVVAVDEPTESFVLINEENQQPILGCTDDTATNYNPEATEDDGSCEFPGNEPVYGCTDADALNYDADATVDDKSCEYEVIEYGPYCGDGVVNQEWEQCDTGSEDSAACSVQCQLTDQTQCTDLTLAKIDNQNVSNEGTGDMTSDIYLGQGSLPIPNNVWFRVYQNGAYDIDPDIDGYEDVPGLAVERSEGSLRTRLFGSRTSVDIEHVDGVIEFWSHDGSVVAESQASDNTSNNPLEGEEAGEGSKGSVGDDEVWIDGGQSYFWLTTNSADDSFYTYYSEPAQCFCELDILSDTGTVVVENNDYAVATYDAHPNWIASIPGATWIWETFLVQHPDQDETKTFLETFTLADVQEAQLDLATDNNYRVTINGSEVATGGSTFNTPTGDSYDVTSYLVDGENTLEIEVTNVGIANSTPQNNPAGALYKLSLKAADRCEITTTPEPVEYGPYCGDGEINQEWEQCEIGDEGCTQRCTLENQCSVLQLAKVSLDDTDSVSFDETLYLGSDSNPIPAGVWFKWDVAGDNPAEDIADAVEGLAVERDQVNGLQVAFRGANDRGDVDLVQGSIELYNLVFGTTERYLVGSLGSGYDLEDFGEGFEDVFEKDGVVKINFDMRADSGNDGATAEIKVDEDAIAECDPDEKEELTCDISASSNPVLADETFTLSWSTNAVGAVEVSHIGSGLAQSDSADTSLTETTTYTLSVFSDDEEQEEPTLLTQCSVEVALKEATRTGGGGGRLIELTDSSDESTGGGAGDGEEPGPIPQVAGEQVSVVPFGAPNTGAGGAAPTATWFERILMVLTQLF